MFQIVVCDDEQEELNSVANMLYSIFEEKGIHCDLHVFHSATELLKTIISADIAILDISMSEINGIDLGRKLKIRFPKIKLIYLTNYVQYCIQAINETHPFSYLCKPLEKEVLQTHIMNLIGDISNLHPSYKRTFYNVQDKSGKRIGNLELDLNQVIYFESIKTERKIAIVLADRIYRFPYVIESLARELKDYEFVVNCRGQLVNMAHVVKVKGYTVHMDTGETLSLAQKRAPEFKSRLNDYLHKSI